MKNRKEKSINWLVITIFACFFVYLVGQHLLVSLYQDDYGYFSLSYAVNAGVTGTQFGLSDILHFLSLHYQSWGGRIVGFFFEIFLGHIHLNVYHIYQSITILGTFIMIYLIGTRQAQVRNSVMALFTVFCYGLFEIMQVRHSIYWVSASCFYVVPLFYFLTFVYCYDKREKIIFKNKFSSILYDLFLSLMIFLATFSQEQIAVAMLGYILIVTGVQLWKDRKLNVSHVFFCLISFISFAILMLAPGNTIRMSHPTSADFYSLSLFRKIVTNVPNIVNGIFGNYSTYFTGAFFFFVTYCAFVNLKKKNHIKYLDEFSFIVSMIMLFGQMILRVSYFGFFTNILGNHMFLLTLFMSGHFLVVIYIVMKYLITHNEWTIFYLVISAILSQGAMIVAPYFALRSAIVFQVICYVFFIYVLSQMKQDCNISIRYLLIPFILFTAFNMGTIFVGYYKNATINKHNDLALKEISKRIHNGENIEQVYLNKLPDILYSGEQPYIEGCEYILDWIYEYYDIPSSVQIEYR